MQCEGLHAMEHPLTNGSLVLSVLRQVYWCYSNFLLFVVDVLCHIL